MVRALGSELLGDTGSVRDPISVRSIIPCFVKRLTLAKVADLPCFVKRLKVKVVDLPDMTLRYHGRRLKNPHYYSMYKSEGYLTYRW